MLNYLLFIDAQDSSAISILADKLAKSNAKSPEVALTETLFSKLIDEPQKVQALSKAFEQFAPKEK